MLEKMAEWGIVKYFGSLINPDTLGRRLNKVLELYETNTFKQAAKRLFIWAIIIIIVATIIDLTFYWLRPEQKETIEKVKEFITEQKEKWLHNRQTRGRKSKR